MLRRLPSLAVGLVVGLALGASLPAGRAQGTAEPSAAARTVWYFYTVKWGHQDEFLALYKKNHYPVLKEQLGSRIVDFKAYVPTYHGDGRADWTFATVLTFRDAAALTTPADEEGIARRLFPDYERFREEERRRFEILEAHWDVPLTEVPME